MNKQSQPPPSPTRRRFLAGVVGGGSAVAGAALAGSAGAVTRQDPMSGRPATTAEPEQRGYHETPHIRRYYELARR